MIIRVDDTKELEGNDVRGGKGPAYSKLLVKNRLRENSCIVAIAENRLPPGSGWGMKKQEGSEEIFYVLQGRPLVKDGDQETELGPGDLILASGGEELAIRNESGEDVVFLGLVLEQRASKSFGFLGTGQSPHSRL